MQAARNAAQEAPAGAAGSKSKKRGGAAAKEREARRQAAAAAGKGKRPGKRQREAAKLAKMQRGNAAVVEGDARPGVGSSSRAAQAVTESKAPEEPPPEGKEQLSSKSERATESTAGRQMSNRKGRGFAKLKLADGSAGAARAAGVATGGAKLKGKGAHRAVQPAKASRCGEVQAVA